MKTYTIPVIWSMLGKHTIKADSLEEAIELAENLNLPEGTYIEGSFEIDEAVYDEYEEG